MKAVQETENRSIELRVFHDLMDSSDFALAAIDYYGQTILWNEAMQNLTGYSKEEMLGQSIEWIMVPGSALEHRKYHRKAMDQARKSDPDDQKAVPIPKVKCDILNKAGEPIPVEITVRTVRPKGRLPYSVAHVDRQAQIQRIEADE